MSNISRINSCVSSRFVNFNHKNTNTNVNTINVEKKSIIEPVFHELIDKLTTFFKAVVNLRISGTFGN